MKNILLTLFLISISMTSFAATVICPISPNLVDFKIDVITEYDKKTKEYIYRYSFTNMKTSKHKIISVYLDILRSTGVVGMSKLPPKWTQDRIDANSAVSDYLDLTNYDQLGIGATVSGFELRSKLKPGPVSYYLYPLSESYITIIPNEGGTEEDLNPICPGDFTIGSSVSDGRIKGVTVGPVPENRVIVKSRLKKIKDLKYSAGSENQEPELELSPLDTGKLNLIVLGSEEVDVTKIDVSSLRFGRGQAKPVSFKIVDSISGISNSEAFKHLLLEFDLDEVNVLCEVDRALFLSGRYKVTNGLFAAIRELFVKDHYEVTKELFSAFRIKPVLCNKKTWIKEEKLIKKDERYLETCQIKYRHPKCLKLRLTS